MMMDQDMIITDGVFKSENTWNPKFKDFSEKWKEGTGSQHGEDAILAAIFSVCEPQNRYCVEIGATQGEDLNTKRFIDDGWTALLIEGLGRWWGGLEKNMSNIPNVTLLNKMVEENEMDDILKEHNIPEDFDLFILDIDSYDYEVWTNMKFRPHVMMVECNPDVLDLDVRSYTPNNWPKGYTSGGMWWDLFKERDYELVCIQKFNMIFIRKDFMKGLLK
jgi:hypothetical protein